MLGCQLSTRKSSDAGKSWKLHDLRVYGTVILSAAPYQESDAIQQAAYQLQRTY